MSSSFHTCYWFPIFHWETRTLRAFIRPVRWNDNSKITKVIVEFITIHVFYFLKVIENAILSDKIVLEVFKKTAFLRTVVVVWIFTLGVGGGRGNPLRFRNGHLSDSHTALYTGFNIILSGRILIWRWLVFSLVSPALFWWPQRLLSISWHKRQSRKLITVRF